MENIIQITEKAAIEIKKIIQKKNIPDDYGLRVGIKGGVGCAGINYLLGFDTKKGDDMELFVNDIQIYLSKKHVMFLSGITLDFYEGSEARGFEFIAAKES